MSRNDVHVHAHPGAAGEASEENPVLGVEPHDRQQRQGAAEEHGAAARWREKRQRSHDRDEIDEMEEVPHKNQAEQRCKEEHGPNGARRLGRKRTNATAATSSKKATRYS